MVNSHMIVIIADGELSSSKHMSRFLYQNGVLHLTRTLRQMMTGIDTGLFIALFYSENLSQQNIFRIIIL